MNKRITKSEYLGFCQDFGGNTECLANLEELPIELQAVWNEITCECAQRGGAGNCCVGSNAHIPINGVLPTDTTTISEQQFLRQAFKEGQGAKNKAKRWSAEQALDADFFFENPIVKSADKLNMKFSVASAHEWECRKRIEEMQKAKAKQLQAQNGGRRNT